MMSDLKLLNVRVTVSYNLNLKKSRMIVWQARMFKTFHFKLECMADWAAPS